MNTEIRDISDRFPNSLKAERMGKHVIVLEDIKDNPRRPIDGKLCDVEMQYIELRNDDSNVDDIVYKEISLWQSKELDLSKTLINQQVYIF